MNWPTLIQRLEEVNRELQPLLAGPDVAPPRANPPASAEALSRLEAARRVRLDRHHRAFLEHADGWKKFSCGTISLLSTGEMTESTALEAGRRNVHGISGVAMGKYRRQRRRLFVVGVSDAALDVLCMPVADGQVQPTVIWFNNTEAEEFPSFEAFIERTVSYGPAKLEYFRSRQGAR